jgi:protein-S-isoprenylcysteine O-methyltransferase Ste14
MPDLVLLIVAAVLLGVGAVLTHRYPRSAWPHGLGIIALILGVVALIWWAVELLLLADAESALVAGPLVACVRRSQT